MADSDISYASLFWSTPATVDGGQLNSVDITDVDSLLDFPPDTVDGGQLNSVDITDVIDVGSYDSGAPGYGDGFAAGYAAALATLTPPSGPPPVPIAIVYEDEPPVDHVDDALRRLLYQYQDD